MLQHANTGLRGFWQCAVSMEGYTSKTSLDPSPGKSDAAMNKGKQLPDGSRVNSYFLAASLNSVSTCLSGMRAKIVKFSDRADVAGTLRDLVAKSNRKLRLQAFITSLPNLRTIRWGRYASDHNAEG